MILVVAGPAVAGPIGFSYSAVPTFRDGRSFMDASGRISGPDGTLDFIDASIGLPTGHAGPVTAASGVIPLISLPTSAFVLGRDPGPGSGIFHTEVSLIDWADPRGTRFDVGVLGEVMFADNDPTRGELRLHFIGAGIQRFQTAANDYKIQLVDRTADGRTWVGAQFTVTPRDGSAPVVETPEPATAMSAAAGLAVVGLWRRKRRAAGLQSV